MMALKHQAPEIYLVEGLGCWGNSTEATYPELTDDLKLPRQEANRLRLSAMAIGIDFGISDGEGHTLKGKKPTARDRMRRQLPEQLQWQHRRL